METSRKTLGFIGFKKHPRVELRTPNFAPGFSIVRLYIHKKFQVHTCTQFEIMIFCLTSPKMCNFLKKGQNFQTLDKHLNIKLVLILKIKHTERISNQFTFKWYKNSSFHV